MACAPGPPRRLSPGRPGPASLPCGPPTGPRAGGMAT